MVWMVRIQCRKCSCSKWTCSTCIYDNICFSSRSSCFMDVDRSIFRRKNNFSRSFHRISYRTGSNHTGSGFVPMWAAVICGLLVSPICYFGVKLIKGKLKIDDALDAFGCHGIGGIWGGIATGLFGMTSINGVAKWNGLVFGETRLFVAQIIGILVSIAVAVVGSLICIAIVRIFTPLRVEERAEKVGLDVSEHGENAYPSLMV